jgi:hypothetical protein
MHSSCLFSCPIDLWIYQVVPAFKLPRAQHPSVRVEDMATIETWNHPVAAHGRNGGNDIHRLGGPPKPTTRLSADLVVQEKVTNVV